MAAEIILSRSVFPGLENWVDPELEPLGRSDFELLMHAAPLLRRLQDGSCWLSHPSGAAWFAASFRAGPIPERGYISFELSYGQNQFLKLWLDALELSLRFARQLGARVFDQLSGLEITEENADDLLGAEGKLLLQQKRIWQDCVSGLESNVQAPLEFPINGYDGVSDYFVFFLEPEQATDSLLSLAEQLNLCVEKDSLSRCGFAVKDPDSGSILSRVILRPLDSALEIRPFYWMEPFKKVSVSCLQLAELLHEKLGGKLYFHDRAFNPELRELILVENQGLGVEFFLWWQSYRQSL